MSIRTVVLSVLLLASSVAARAAPVPLQVGGATILFPAPPGHVAISKDQPALFAYSAAALPPRNRLVESFYTPADLATVLQGGVIADVYYQVQAPRAIESRVLGSTDWERIKKELIASMPTLDMDKLIAADSGRDARMSKVSGQPVNVSFAGMETPAIVRDAPTSVTYGMVLPVKVGVGASTAQATLAVAASAMLVRNRMLYVFAYSADASPSGVRRLHSGFEATVDAMAALNASDPGVPSSDGIDWARIGSKGLVGAVIGGFVGLLVWWVRRRRTA